MRKYDNVCVINIVANSPIFGHVIESLQGLTTIRAFKTQELLQNEFDNHQDLHSTVWYIFLSASRSFSMWLDIVCIIFLSTVTLSFFIMETGLFKHHNLKKNKDTNPNISKANIYWKDTK